MKLVTMPYLSLQQKKKILDDFKKRLYQEVREIHITRFPYNHFLYPDYDENLAE